MKNKKRRLEQFLFFDYTGIEAHLAKMAAKGWQIDKITPFCWKYRRIEPQSLTYTVTYFSEASDFNPYPTMNQQTFHDYCEKAGWKLAAEWAQMQIFCTAQEEPTPIETDEPVKLKAIHKSMKKNFLPGGIMLLLLSLFQVFLQLHMCAQSPTDWLSNNTSLFSALIWGIFALYMLTNLTVYGVWYYRSGKAAGRGETGLESSSSYQKAQLIWLLLEGIAVVGTFLSLSSQYLGWMGVWLIAYMALMLTVPLIRNALKWAGASKKLNLTITIISIVVLAVALSGIMTGLITRGIRNGMFSKKPVETYTTTQSNGDTHTWEIYHDSLPLTVEDLQDIAYDHYSYEWTANESILLAQYVARQNSFTDGQQAPELRYTILDTKLPGVFDVCLNEYLDRYDWDPLEDERHYQRTDDPAWQADGVYQLYFQEEAMAEYILCWGSRIVYIRFDEMPSASQIAIAAKKLRGYKEKNE